MEIILIAGLGNPGKEYARTRHNAGFMFVDYFFEKFRDVFGFSDWNFRKKINALVSIGRDKNRKIILMKPQTFMNLSGETIKAAVKYFILGLTSNSLLVVHDEIDLPLGAYRFSSGSSSAGHKGVQNIIDLMGTKNFKRLRIGVDNRKDKKASMEKYVLNSFIQDELQILGESIENSSSELAIKIKTQSAKRKTTVQS